MDAQVADSDFLYVPIWRIFEYRSFGRPLCFDKKLVGNVIENAADVIADVHGYADGKNVHSCGRRVLGTEDTKSPLQAREIG